MGIFIDIGIMSTLCRTSWSYTYIEGKNFSVYSQLYGLDDNSRELDLQNGKNLWTFWTADSYIYFKHGAYAIEYSANLLTPGQEIAGHFKV